MSAKSKAEKHADTLAGMIDGKDDDLSKTLEPIRKFLLSLDETKKTKSASDPKLVAAPKMLKCLQAIVARIHGVYDDPALLKWGGLHHDSDQDILFHAEKIIAKATRKS